MAPDIFKANAELNSPGQSEPLSRRRKIKIAVRKKREENKRRDNRKWRNVATIWRKVGRFSDGSKVGATHHSFTNVIAL